MDPIRLDPQYTWRAARRSGVSRRQIAEDGVPLARGLYISRSVEPDLLIRCRAWALVLPDDAAFSHVTAGELLGAPVAPCPVPHVALTPRRVLPQWTGLVVHGRRMRPQDSTVHNGLRVTSGAQMTVDGLTERLHRADRVRGVVRARACAPLLSGKAMSRPESLIRYWVLTSELPTPRAQVPVVDRWGAVRAHADLGFEEWRIAVEYEGRQHADDDQFGRDIDRYSLMAAEGWVILRFAKRQLTRAVVLDRTRRTLLSRGWRPPRRVGC